MCGQATLPMYARTAPFATASTKSPYPSTTTQVPRFTLVRRQTNAPGTGDCLVRIIEYPSQAMKNGIQANRQPKPTTIARHQGTCAHSGKAFTKPTNLGQTELMLTKQKTSMAHSTNLNTTRLRLGSIYSAVMAPNGMELTGGPLRGAQPTHAGRPC
jgi:hypothetical protein